MILPLLATALAQAQSAPSPAATLAPSEIVAAAPAADWMAIAPQDLLVMELAADSAARPRRVVIQLIPAPFSQGWIGNIRTLAAAHWWDGTSVNRVQDNYVAQWGDATEKKPLPAGLVTVPESAYETEVGFKGDRLSSIARYAANMRSSPADAPPPFHAPEVDDGYLVGFPTHFSVGQAWPIHCYGAVGVGRNLSPDTGTGAELYTVIGHAPRHLDRNLAVVGRVIAGIEHLSSLPRGSEALGFYKTPAERTTIRSIRLATDLPAAERPRFEYLSTESATFARYADARANRRDAFFIRPAGDADICNIPVPVRAIAR